MNTLSVGTTFALSVAAYLTGALASLASWRKPALARRICCSAAVAGAALGGLTSVQGILRGTPVAWSLSSGIPLFAYSFSYDALAGFFNLALAILVAAVSIYSFGYLKEFEGKRNIGIFGFLFHLLLLSLTIVFTAANAFLFLIAWEVMALAAYGLVTFYHEDRETRRAGLLYIIMAHIDAGCLLLGFALLIHASGSAEFASFRPIATLLSSGQQTAAFVLFFLGFGIKAGVIPFHIWLPAAHPVAPSNVSALLSGIVIKTGIYGMARIFLDSLGGVPSWAGLLVLIVGVVSAVLGVLYALMEHDLKRLLAYHSIENIGIILMGLGAALIFRVAGHPQLACVALIAAMFHTLNHAIFKCLLFLGAGSVLHSTGTRNMEEMGGLIRPMPVTAFCFLIGAVAISGLPPLNGFVSEWLTYQTLLAGFGAIGGLTRILFPLAGSMLALTGALAAACFVKAFAITFLALPRGTESRNAHEAPRTMLIGMGWLTLACAALGLGVTWFLPVFDAITEQLLGQRVAAHLVTGHGLVLSAGMRTSGTVSTAVIAVGLLVLVLAAVPVVAIGVRRFGRRHGPVWDCGLPGLSEENEYTATAFSKALRMIFSVLYKPRREIQAVFDVSPYYPKEIRFESEIESTFEKRLYAPLQVTEVLTNSGQAVQITQEFELATAERSNLSLTAEYTLNADRTHRELRKVDRQSVNAKTQVESLGAKARERIHKLLGRSLAIREMDAGSCNGCELEITALNNPIHDIERFGIQFVASPRHADMLLVTGPVTRNMELALLKTHRAMAEPKVVVAVGACGISGGIFGVNYASLGGVDKTLPVDVYIPGCPPRPQALLHGILLAVGRLAERRHNDRAG